MKIGRWIENKGSVSIRTEETGNSCIIRESWCLGRLVGASIVGKASLGGFASLDMEARAQVFRKSGFSGAGAQKLLVQVLEIARKASLCSWFKKHCSQPWCCFLLEKIVRVSTSHTTNAI